jgi:hypothetical protein
MSYEYFPTTQVIGAYKWLTIFPCSNSFAECDSIQIDINEYEFHVDMDRIPTLIQALNKAYELSTGEPEMVPVMQLVEMMDAVDGVLQAFGAPGDYGYATDQGKALFKLHNVRRRKADSKTQEATNV